jgi:hypothetical protein
MKRLLLLIPLSLILYACPYESAVGLDAAPTEPIDSSLCGYWYGIIKDGSDFFGIEALDISKRSDSVYSITRYGKTVKGDMVVPDTAYFTGYLSRLQGQLFMNVEGTIVLISTAKKSKTPVATTQKVFYVSSLNVRNDTMIVKTVTDNFSPLARKGFRTPEQLRSELNELMIQKKNIYDDTCSLSYRKIEKPQPMKGP